jgi:uncharacterized protein DUF4388
MKSSAPFKLFGLVLNPNDQGLFSCIEAISCTPAPAVRSALEELAKRFPNHEVGKAATKALASLAAPPAPSEPSASSSPSATLSGDLDIFGLPALLQSLAESRVTGSVLLRDRKGEIFGTIGLRTGKLKACQTGQLSGEEAFFQLFERPVPGTFLFSRLPDPAADESGSAKLREILPLSLEGMRRYDELQQAAAILPDEVALKSTDVKPTAPPEEKDGILLRELWNRAAAGATPKDCEAAVKADSYRIRRLLVHWVSTGSLVAA